MSLIADDAEFMDARLTEVDKARISEQIARLQKAVDEGATWKEVVAVVVNILAGVRG